MCVARLPRSRWDPPLQVRKLCDAPTLLHNARSRICSKTRATTSTPTKPQGGPWPKTSSPSRSAPRPSDVPSADAPCVNPRPASSAPPRNIGAGPPYPWSLPTRARQLACDRRTGVLERRQPTWSVRRPRRHRPVLGAAGAGVEPTHPPSSHGAPSKPRRRQLCGTGVADAGSLNDTREDLVNEHRVRRGVETCFMHGDAREHLDVGGAALARRRARREPDDGPRDDQSEGDVGLGLHGSVSKRKRGARCRVASFKGEARGASR